VLSHDAALTHRYVQGFEHVENKPVKSLIERCTSCSAGIEFSLWVVLLCQAGMRAHLQRTCSGHQASMQAHSCHRSMRRAWPAPQPVPAGGCMLASQRSC
jgi:hypothetical protein